MSQLYHRTPPDKEQEVLRLIAAGVKKAEVARRVKVSLPTVYAILKRHAQ